MVLVSSASTGPRVSGCTRAPRYFNPYPVYAKNVTIAARPPTQACNIPASRTAHGFSRVVLASRDSRLAARVGRES
eukprot:scaffold56477_cov54-Phaeocystis_antarctica.AAC.2